MKNTGTSAKRMKILLVVVMVLLLIMINMVGISVVEKFSVKLDLTDNKLYDLSEATAQVAASLTEPVTITVFSRRDDFVIMLRELLDRYDALSGQISVIYKDPYENPVLIDSYKQKGITIKQDDIVVEGEYRLKQYAIQDMYNMNAAQTAVTGMKAEQQITGSLLYVNDTSVPVVRFTDGHNERPTTALMSLFEQNNFDVGRTTLSVMGIGDNTDVLVIASPTRDFEPKEIDSLDTFMNRGGSLMVFIEPSVNEYTNLEAFINGWGIGLGDKVVFEKEAYVSGNPINIVPMYVQHEINQYFGDNRYFLTMPSTRNLFFVENSSYDLDVKALLVSSGESYAKSGVDFETAQKRNSDETGPFYLAMTSSRQVLRDGKEDEAKLFVAGSRNMFGDDILGTSTYANADFLTQSINWLNEMQSSINIPAKNIEADPISVLPNEAKNIGIVLIGVLPAMVLVAGFVIYFRRKNL